ncbi:uncharacterized protein MONBRDRAFT_10450 [Monosiga brevicollis MX1]|uniref:Protein kinase domain-containing protein n=1 Tax=Monosiga brevicollis TaxID=81824 RepID=A9V688_MONBE|nr:uncharacterized protein MONBRDRAFT_10450 [Monosiga brevicollis MX1]EDQ86947.1 predicted protein [Monosiga brevicollis MX1]|eukprot:XP_001748186.1 hypothetical protein [Monosiga brevicollis MX1]
MGWIWLAVVLLTSGLAPALGAGSLCAAPCTPNFKGTYVVCSYRRLLSLDVPLCPNQMSPDVRVTCDLDAATTPVSPDWTVAGPHVAPLFNNMSSLSLQTTNGPCCTLPQRNDTAFPTLKKLDLQCTTSLEFWATLPTPLFTTLATLRLTVPASNALSPRDLPPPSPPLVGVTAFDISAADLVQVTPDATFDGLPNLSVLNLAGNLLTAAPGQLWQRLTALRFLDLSDNYLQNLDSAALPSSLQVLNLSRNRLPTLPAAQLQALTQLQELHLGSNVLTTLAPGVFAPTSNLRQLTLAANHLTDLPSTGLFAALTRLQLLELSDNALTKLRAGALRGLGQLRTINLSFNQLQTMEAQALATVPQLRVLNMTGNAGLKTFPTELFAHQGLLEQLLFPGCGLTGFASNQFDALTSLQQLAFYSNNVATIHPQQFARLTNLVYLPMASNRLKELPPHIFDSLTRLEVLYIDSHRFTSLPPGIFDRLTNLQQLFAYNLNLTSIDPGLVRHNTNLRYLDLSNSFQPAHSQTVDLQLSGLVNLTTLLLTSLQLPAGTNQALLARTNLEHVELGGASVCDPATGIGNFTLSDAMSRFVLQDTNCEAIWVAAHRVAAEVVLMYNKQLTSVTVRAIDLHELAVSHNPVLRTLSSPACTEFDMSGTPLPYDDRYCQAWGQNVFQARSLSDPSSYSDNLARFLRNCFYNAAILDLSGNGFMNRLTVMRETLGQPFLVGTGMVQPRVQINRMWTPVLSFAAVPALVLQDVPAKCSLQSRWDRIFDQANNNEAVDVYQQFDCACVPGYSTQGAAGTCTRNKTFLDHWWGILIVVVASTLVTLPFFICVLRVIFRRLRKVEDDLELNARLLENAETVVSALKKGWEIDFEELALRERIDGSIPGTFGEVYRAEWGKFEVCVKVLRLNWLHMDPMVRQDFEKEAEFLQQTKHRNLVRFFGLGETNWSPPAPFIVLELVERGALNDVLNKEHLPWRTKLSIAADASRGLAFIHSLGHLHRDVKSGNCLITSDYRCKINDFGTLKRPSEDREREHLRGVEDDEGWIALGSLASTVASTGSSQAALMTMSTTAGTPMYMAPECLLQGKVSPAADVFAFSLILWELHFERSPDILRELEVPLRGPLFPTLCRVYREGRHLPLEGMVDWYQRLCAACMSLEPADRPSFDSVLHELEATLAHPDLDMEVKAVVSQPQLDLDTSTEEQRV